MAVAGIPGRAQRAAVKDQVILLPALLTPKDSQAGLGKDPGIRFWVWGSKDCPVFRIQGLLATSGRSWNCFYRYRILVEVAALPGTTESRTSDLTAMRHFEFRDGKMGTLACEIANKTGRGRPNVANGTINDICTTRSSVT